MAPLQQTSLSLPLPSAPVHPFAHSNQLLEVLPDKIDIEEESRLYDELCLDEDQQCGPHSAPARPLSPQSFGPPSVFSKDIWLGDNLGESPAFARDVKISGWTNVGDKTEGGYVVYDCVIQTKEGTVIHAHKRYSAFAQLQSVLRRTLPRNQQHLIPTLPPKTSLSRYRPAFLDGRRRQLQLWLASILLHPDIGGSPAVKAWVMD